MTIHDDDSDDDDDEYIACLFVILFVLFCYCYSVNLIITITHKKNIQKRKFYFIFHNKTTDSGHQMALLIIIKSKFSIFFHYFSQ